MLPRLNALSDFAVCLCGALAVVLALPRPMRADDTTTTLPRYKFEVGQQLNYEGGGEDKNADGTKRGSQGHWEFDVLRHNADGSYRMLFRMASNSSEIDKDGKEQKSPEKTDIALLDMDATGKMTQLFGSFGYSLNPSNDLPPLPVNQEQLAQGWESTGQFGSTMHYLALPESNSTEFVFSAEEDTPFHVIYESEDSKTMTFDRELGLISKMTETSKWNWKNKSEGTGELKFVGIQRHDADWATKLDADAEKFFAAQQKFSKATEADDATPESFDQAIADLKLARGKIDSLEFQQQLDRQLTDFEKYRKSSEEDLQNRKALLGQPAEEFKTTDLNDKPQALADYRGKVVLLDFWYRGCGWCIRSMPVLKKVAEHYQGQPVVVLGMNTDRDLDDAKFVVDKLGLNYTNLKAEGLPQKFNVHGFPTMIIIDQTGNISDIHVGYSPTLEQDLTAKIDRLLTEAK